MEKLKRVEIRQVDPYSLTVGWIVDCAEKLGIVQGYRVYYCMVADISNKSCDGKLLNVLSVMHHLNNRFLIKSTHFYIGIFSEFDVDGPNVDNARITGLKPFTYYIVAVSVKTVKGESEISNSLHIRTNETGKVLLNDIRAPPGARNIEIFL